MNTFKEEIVNRIVYKYNFKVWKLLMTTMKSKCGQSDDPFQSKCAFLYKYAAIWIKRYAWSQTSGYVTLDLHCQADGNVNPAGSCHFMCRHVYVCVCLPRTVWGSSNTRAQIGDLIIVELSGTRTGPWPDCFLREIRHRYAVEKAGGRTENETDRKTKTTKERISINIHHSGLTCVQVPFCPQCAY